MHFIANKKHLLLPLFFIGALLVPTWSAGATASYSTMMGAASDICSTVHNTKSDNLINYSCIQGYQAFISDKGKTGINEICDRLKGVTGASKARQNACKLGAGRGSLVISITSTQFVACRSYLKYFEPFNAGKQSSNEKKLTTCLKDGGKPSGGSNSPGSGSSGGGGGSSGGGSSTSPGGGGSTSPGGGSTSPTPKDEVEFNKTKPLELSDFSSGNWCGEKGKGEIKTSIDFGCSHRGNAILDMLFALIRFLSYGAGLVIIASLVWAGIQYIIARDNPQDMSAAKNRIQGVFIALLLFIFSAALLNYIIPGAILK